MKKILIMLIAVSAIALPGCAFMQKTVAPALTEVEARIQDAQAIVDAIRSVVNVFFLAKPAPEAQAKVEKVMGDVSLSLSAAVRVLKGVDHASNEQLDAAWADFRGSYAELLTLLHNLGIVSQDNKMATRRGVVALPEPLAMGNR